MDSHNRVPIPAFLLFIWIVVSSSCSALFPITKEGCEEKCGEVSIPYPFGTKEGCYLRREFFINCSEHKKPTVGVNVALTNISLEGQLSVISPSGYACYGDDSGPHNSFMRGSPMFTFNSTVNKFTMIGCHSRGILRGKTYEHAYTTGCFAKCDNKTNNKTNIRGGSCSGIGCCQISIPDGAWEIDVSVELYKTRRSVWNFDQCSYAFVGDSNFQFHAENLTNFDSRFIAPLVVDWVVEYKFKCEKAKNRSSYACAGKNSECVNEKSGYRCRCKHGFEGNPYLPKNGCRDIDECAAPNHSGCKSHMTCVNTPGSYFCKCNKGYHSNGVTGADSECIAEEPSQTKIYLPIFAAVGSCTIVVVLLYFWYSKMITMKEDSLREEYFRKNGGFLLQEKLNASEMGANCYSVRIFTAEELQKATNDFDNTKIIGQGGFGTVYKGVLIDETIVAIKKSRGIDQRGVEQFINEVILLSRINNRNVVKLLGCCLETEMPLLVYEFINNGTLLEHLKGLVGNRASKLSWNIRMRIASQVAGVLFYLHSCASPQIIHRDIKSSNILLDQDCMAKVADFGISRLVSMDENQLSTMVQGTPGYLDPEYMHTGVFTEKSDVYSFGVVLIELLTANKVFSIDRPEAERFLASYFLHQMNNDNLVGVLDHNMGYNFENIEQIKEVSMIAKRCISVKGEDRPYMKEVLRDLETLEMQDHNFVANVLEKDSKACGSSDGHPCTFTSSDLSPVTTTTMEHMLPVAGGR